MPKSSKTQTAEKSVTRKPVAISIEAKIKQMEISCKKSILQLATHHDKYVKSLEKAISSLKGKLAKAQTKVKAMQDKKATVKAKLLAKKTASNKAQLQKATAAHQDAVNMVKTIKTEISTITPKLKAAKLALKQHDILSKAIKSVEKAAKSTVTKQQNTAKVATTDKPSSKRIASQRKSPSKKKTPVSRKIAKKSGTTSRKTTKK